MRALVTGAAGFVGRHLVPRLERAGFEVTATDRDLDVADPGAVDAALARLRPDAVLHLAAASSVADSWQRPQLAFRVNYLGTHSVLTATARHAPHARVLLVGSSEQYARLAPGEPPLSEAAPQRPRSPYGRSKAAADLLGARHAAHGLDVVRVRAFNHTGPGQTDAFVLASFAKQLAQIECGRAAPELRVGNLGAVRDFLDVDDVIEAYLALLDPAVPAGVYNVASGRGVRIGEALERLVALMGVRPRVRVDPERLRPADASVGDASRLRAATGWRPRRSLDDTLRRLATYWRGQVAAA